MQGGGVYQSGDRAVEGHQLLQHGPVRRGRLLAVSPTQIFLRNDGHGGVKHVSASNSVSRPQARVHTSNSRTSLFLLAT